MFYDLLEPSNQYPIAPCELSNSPLNKVQRGSPLGGLNNRRSQDINYQLYCINIRGDIIATNYFKDREAIYNDFFKILLDFYVKQLIIFKTIQGLLPWDSNKNSLYGRGVPVTNIGTIFKLLSMVEQFVGQSYLLHWIMIWYNI